MYFNLKIPFHHCFEVHLAMLWSLKNAGEDIEVACLHLKYAGNHDDASIEENWVQDQFQVWCVE